MNQITEEGNHVMSSHSSLQTGNRRFDIENIPDTLTNQNNPSASNTHSHGAFDKRLFSFDLNSHNTQSVPM